MTSVSALQQSSSFACKPQLPTFNKCPGLVGADSNNTLASPPSESDIVDEDATPVPANLDELAALLHKELDGEGLTDVNVDRISALMSGYKSNREDWEKFAMFDSNRYTRNLVDSGNGKFNLMILCWGPGHSSPVHDHSNSHCLVKVLDGSICETQYDWPTDSSLTPAHSNTDSCASLANESGSSLDVKMQATHTRDAVTYMHDTIGLHKVSNPSSMGAISLHLYTPPFDTCTTFCEKTGASRSSGKCVFYSSHGERATYIQDIKESIAARTAASGPASSCISYAAPSKSRC
ncbi:hypothetical protein BASA50_009725 [Batrachochytrium salamandrivorans]|uniref:Cysteine dioxygenase n=1 Tax=Batrachochytrium salamandrivorans TaxID=1357716 RepID=A0ABQ8F0R0_9FUNG|nr:hypothetical protein BASA62_004652 [Batrachochytrium salamandrivorans]KAH6570992.1 hypothetical protein BASA60_007421 [Batrachochytrium salamandrivorans]KAH6590023.1 hypothetical protein BASA50_009725 [Batrachochytrium salamandrivorans]KAH9252621.1 hypothetical protein BASA81_009401 [Batrachochytrium salamandrivorans]KAH9270116.1 hypothetical protein BASA83_007791 [Batrachochytrium salamandrivorans]